MFGRMNARVTETVRHVHVVETRREGMLTDERLAECLGVDLEHHVLTGVREVVARLEDKLLTEAGTVEAPTEQRLGAVNGFAALEDLRILIEKWRMAGKAETRNAERGTRS